MGSIYDNTKDFSAGSVVDFQRAATLMDSAFGYYDVDLSQARTNVILDISGDFLFADLSTNGVATIELNNQMDAPEAPIMFAAGLAINNVPFKQLKISNTAQAGCTMRLLYSTGRSIVPSASMANINQILQPVTVRNAIGINNHHYYLAAALGVGINQITQIIAPAANKNGVMVRGSVINAAAGANGYYEGTLIASANQPNNNQNQNNASMLAYMYTNNTTQSSIGDFDTYTLIPKGWGMWMIESAGTAAPTRTMMLDYEIL